MFDLAKFLSHQSAQTERLTEQRLAQILQAYRAEARSAAVIDWLELDLLPRLRISPVLRASEEFVPTLEAAILSLRGWLLGFSAAALILVSLSVGIYQRQSPVGLEEVLTYNVDSTHRDSILFADDSDYVR